MKVWVSNYLSQLINQIYKILPLAEEKNPDLSKYIDNLIREICGNEQFLKDIYYDGTMMRVVSILSYWIYEQEPISLLRRDVFKAISLCNIMKEKIEDYNL